MTLTAHAQGMTSFWITSMLFFPTADDFLIYFKFTSILLVWTHHVSPSRFGDSKFDQAQRQFSLNAFCSKLPLRHDFRENRGVTADTPKATSPRTTKRIQMVVSCLFQI